MTHISHTYTHTESAYFDETGDDVHVRSAVESSIVNLLLRLLSRNHNHHHDDHDGDGHRDQSHHHD